ncbi:unnamed protein product, partial [Brachionus calyciflorus]
MDKKIFGIIILLYLTGLSRLQSLNDVNARYKCGIASENSILPWIGLAYSSNEKFLATIISEYYVITTSVRNFGIFETVNWGGFKIKRQINHPTVQLS